MTKFSRFLAKLNAAMYASYCVPCRSEDGHEWLTVGAIPADGFYVTVDFCPHCQQLAGEVIRVKRELFLQDHPDADKCSICGEKIGDDCVHEPRSTGENGETELWPYCRACWEEMLRLRNAHPVSLAKLWEAIDE